MMVETHQVHQHQVVHMEHLEVVEHHRQVNLEAKVVVVMEGMELALLGYQHNSVEQVQIVVQDILAVEAVVVRSLVRVLVAVVALVVVLVDRELRQLQVMELQLLDLVVEEILRAQLPVMEERVLLSP
jgi:hypothetical protein|tara:strand:- start:29 stop:412 length:384 start_codon:yes stop_codon:yes gene_type:complete